jgi:hypothetical protein
MLLDCRLIPDLFLQNRFMHIREGKLRMAGYLTLNSIFFIFFLLKIFFSNFFFNAPERSMIAAQSNL